MRRTLMIVVLGALSACGAPSATGDGGGPDGRRRRCSSASTSASPAWTSGYRPGTTRSRCPSTPSPLGRTCRSVRVRRRPGPLRRHRLRHRPTRTVRERLPAPGGTTTTTTVKPTTTTTRSSRRRPRRPDHQHRPPSLLDQYRPHLLVVVDPDDHPVHVPLGHGDLPRRDAADLDHVPQPACAQRPDRHADVLHWRFGTADVPVQCHRHGALADLGRDRIGDAELHGRRSGCESRDAGVPGELHPGHDDDHIHDDDHAGCHHHHDTGAHHDARSRRRSPSGPPPRCVCVRCRPSSSTSSTSSRRWPGSPAP